MRIKLLCLILISAAFVAAGNAQSVVITGKKVTYNRPKPQSEYKKTFTINYPKVKAATPALSKKIESAISYERVLKLDLKDELNDSQWLEEADYEVGYNKNNILSIALTMSGTAAYPDGTTKYVVVHLKTGMQVTATTVFSNAAGLLKIVEKAKDKEVAESIIEIKKDPENSDLDVAGLFKENAEFNKLSLKEFSVDDNGVTFYYDYGFPHVMKGIQPLGEFTFTWEQLKPYIKSSGLLGRMVS